MWKMRRPARFPTSALTQRSDELSCGNKHTPCVSSCGDERGSCPAWCGLCWARRGLCSPPPPSLRNHRRPHTKLPRCSPSSVLPLALSQTTTEETLCPPPLLLPHSTCSPQTSSPLHLFLLLPSDGGMRVISAPPSSFHIFNLICLSLLLYQSLTHRTGASAFKSRLSLSSSSAFHFSSV